MSKGIAKSDKVPKSRFNIDAYLHPDNERPGSFNVPGGYFLNDDPHAFDPGMFNISPVEASWMDPQQKKLLEVVYEALENSGTTLEDAAGRKTGCYIGCFSYDFQFMTMKEPDFRHAYTATGVDTGLLANRVSYVFDLKGPSLTVNTACSSTLYALDLACQAISTGECDSAIVGGTNIILTVDQQMNTAKLGVLSPNNQSRPFDEAADGYGRAEGFGALYLMPLSAAIREGKPVRAVIRATATGSNGKHGVGAGGITHPSIKGQTDVTSLAYSLGKLSPEETTYVECHGTGTPVGDPVEVRAIHEALGAARPQGDPILIGSVKPNIGHSEAASSIGTLIKAVLALENGIIPPTAGVTKLSTSIRWDEMNVKVVTAPIAFSSSRPLRRIGISAYGYGGTVAHAVLESAKSIIPDYCSHKFMRPIKDTPNGSGYAEADADRPYLLLFSAHDRPTLKNNIDEYSTLCQDVNLLDFAYTLGLRRTKFQERAFAIVGGEIFNSSFEAASADIRTAPREAACPAFVFTGQGAQWPQMGMTLLDIFPSLRHTIRRLDQHLSTLSAPPSWKIEEVLMEPEDRSLINLSRYSQPLCTAVQIILVDLLTHWGVRPSVTIGHSSGEIGAAYAAGLISAETAITVAYYRGLAVATLNTDGAMIAVGLGSEDASHIIDDLSYNSKLVVACHNSPSMTTLSGDRDAVEKLKELLDREGIFARILKTDGQAYHSPHMGAIAPKYAEYLRNEIHPDSSSHRKIPMFSTVGMRKLTYEEGGIPESYWVDNLTNPVLFSQGVQFMIGEMPEINLLIEIGPHSALGSSLRQICQSINKASVGYLPTLKRGENDGHQMLRLAGSLWAGDAHIDIAAVTRIETLSEVDSVEERTGSLLVDLPPYHWTYPKYTFAESRISREQRNMSEPRHDILGRRVTGVSTLDSLWRNVLRQRDLPWIAHHRLGGEVMLPATGYLALAMEAITQVNAESEEILPIYSYTMRDVAITSAIVVPDDDEGTETLFHLQPMDNNPNGSKIRNTTRWFQFLVSSCSYGTWKEAARGLVALNVKGQASDHKPQALPDTQHRAAHIDWLDKNRTVGFDLGPAFHHIRDIYTNGEFHVTRGDMGISRECGLIQAESRYVLHPTILDSCLQPFHATMHRGRIDDLRCGAIPTHFGEVTVFPPSDEQLANRCVVQNWCPRLGNIAFSSNVQLIAYDGKLLVDMTDSRSVLYRAALPPEMKDNLQRDLYMKLDWKIDADYLGWADDTQSLPDLPLMNGVLDILLHKDAAADVLSLDDSLTQMILAIRPSLAITVAASGQKAKDDLKARYAAYEALRFVDSDLDIYDDLDISSITGLNRRYDLIAIPAMDRVRGKPLEDVLGILNPTGSLAVRVSANASEEWNRALKERGFSHVIDQVLPDGIILKIATQRVTISDNFQPRYDGVLLVYRHEPTSVLSAISKTLKYRGQNVRSLPISSVGQVSGEQVILLADAEGPFLAHLDEQGLNGLINLIKSAPAMIWVTCGGLLTGDRPEYGMTAGAVRTLRRENASLDLVTVDLDSSTTSQSRAPVLLADIVTRQRTEGRNGETEYYVHNGAVYVGRLVPNRDLNRQFVPDSGETTTVYQCDRPAIRAGFENGAGVFFPDSRTSETLRPDEVEVHMAAIGLSSLDGADESTFFSHEIVGTVTRTGSQVDHLQPGTKVAGFALDRFATFQRTSSKLVQPLPDGCSLTEAATLPSAFATAFYGFETLARIVSGENVVIMDGMGAVALAAIQLCRVFDANAIVVTSSPVTIEYICNDNLLPSHRVINSNDGNIESRLREATGAKGVDIIFCSTDVDEATVIECGRNLALFGRVVTFGNRRNYYSIISRLSQHTEDVSLFHFDLAEIIRHRTGSISSVLSRTLELYGAGDIKPLRPLTIKGPAEINEALQSIPSDMGLGKFVVSYDEDAAFKVTPSRTPLRFKEDATYLMVGCLGGLGRQVALWMASRGAKHLAFISRTGTVNPAAADVVQSLQDQGVEALVLRADIMHKDELADAIDKIGHTFPIRGIVNAANVFHDTVFLNMTMDAWKEVVDTKVRGSRNLHEIFQHEPLDFFVMTSSVASTLGSSGQTSYSAANAFLDSLARHRRARGLPAVSLILPAIFGIGHIAEDPEIEKSIAMKGMYGIREKEMLEAFEVAMTPQSALPTDVDHVVVGIQPRRFGRAVEASGAHVPWRDDPRLNWMATAMEEQARHDPAKGHGRIGGASTDNILATIRGALSAEQATEAVAAHLSRRLGRLLMIEDEVIQMTQKSIASYGLDSMIGAEFRNWIFREFKVDIPFQQLLAGSFTIPELAKMLCKNATEGF
ncbi:putative polyketide synthase [Hypoxylon rubiginosum]|uniref:Polyketide synthase n=1 Tax=Hypoxylon rubiginosum TaxID=110542 RepID=A0ACB9Z051_9PEZI|nr:putative polyketide synthase [Hypoxylon rubiginosum]